MADETRRISRRASCFLFLGSLSLYLLTAGGSLSSTDATVMFDLTRNIVEHRSIALSANLLGSEQNRGVDGRFYSQYGLGQSLYNVPFYLAGIAAREAIGRPIGKPDTIPKAVVALGNTVAAAACIVVIFLFALALSGAARPALLAAGTVAVASPLWPYSKFGFSVPLTTLLLCGAALLLWRAARSARAGPAALAGTLMAVAWLTRHEIVVVLVPFAAFLWIEGRRRGTPVRRAWQQMLALVGCAAVGGVAWALYNVVRFGSPTNVGYSPWFTGEGYLALLASPSGALLLFCPVAVVWLVAVCRPEITRGERLLLLGPLVCFFLLYGSLHDWMGGRSYGPRYMLPSLFLLAPALPMLLRAGSRTVRGAAVTVMLVSTVVQLPGILVDYSKVSLDWARARSQTEDATRPWHWDASPLVLNTRASLKRVPDNASYLAGWVAPPAAAGPTADDDRDFAQRFSFSVDFWWAYLVYLGVLPRRIALALALALATSAAGFLSAAWRTTGMYDRQSKGRVQGMTPTGRLFK